MTENDVNMTESERLEKWSRGFISIRASWQRSPGSRNVEYLYFQIYTHNTGIHNTMTDEVMDAEMSEWVNGRGDDDQ